MKKERKYYKQRNKARLQKSVLMKWNYMINLREFKLNIMKMLIEVRRTQQSGNLTNIKI